MDIAQLQAALVAAKETDPDPPVVVRGAGDVEYQKVIDVLDLIRQLEITKLGLATEVIQTVPR
jgi:biopolymer transport protein ExbD